MSNKDIFHTILWTILLTTLGLSLLGAIFLGIIYYHPDYSIEKFKILIAGSPQEGQNSYYVQNTKNSSLNDIGENRYTPPEITIIDKKRLEDAKDLLRQVTLNLTDMEKNQAQFQYWSGKADLAKQELRLAERQLQRFRQKTFTLSEKIRTLRVSLANGALIKDRQRLAQQSKQAAIAADMQALMAIADAFNAPSGTEKERRAAKDLQKANQDSQRFRKNAQTQVTKAEHLKNMRIELNTLETDYLSALKAEPAILKRVQAMEQNHRTILQDAQIFSSAYKDIKKSTEALRWQVLAVGHLFKTPEDVALLEKFLKIEIE